MSLRYVLLLQRDLQKAVRFYGDAVGLPVRVVTERWAELAAGPAILALKASEGCVSAASLGCGLLIELVIELGASVEHALQAGQHYQPGHAPRGTQHRPV